MSNCDLKQELLNIRSGLSRLSLILSKKDKTDSLLFKKIVEFDDFILNVLSEIEKAEEAILDQSNLAISSLYTTDDNKDGE